MFAALEHTQGRVRRAGPRPLFLHWVSCVCYKRSPRAIYNTISGRRLYLACIFASTHWRAWAWASARQEQAGGKAATRASGSSTQIAAASGPRRSRRLSRSAGWPRASSPSGRPPSWRNPGPPWREAAAAGSSPGREGEEEGGLGEGFFRCPRCTGFFSWPELASCSAAPAQLALPGSGGLARHAARACGRMALSTANLPDFLLQRRSSAAGLPGSRVLARHTARACGCMALSTARAALGSGRAPTTATATAGMRGAMAHARTACGRGHREPRLKRCMRVLPRR